MNHSHQKRSFFCSRFAPLAAVAIGIAMLCTHPSMAAPLFWENEISTALDARDSCYAIAGIDTAMFRRLQVDSSRITKLSPDTMCVWFDFLNGLSCPDSDESAVLWFKRALLASDKDPGRLWVLSVEFDRCGKQSWEEKCFDKLELLFLISGANSAPVLSQQLLCKSAVASTHGNTREADFFDGWALRFDRHSTVPVILAKLARGITDFPAAAGLARQLVISVSNSWEAQFGTARAIARWLFLVAQFLVAGILLGLGARLLSPSLHVWAERFPDVFSSRGKLFLMAAVFFSAVFLGAIAFLWISFFVVWRRLSPRDKIPAVVALSLFLLLPLSVRLSDMLDRTLSAGGSVSLYKQVIDEGWYEALDSVVASRAINGPDYLVHTGAALYSCKKGAPGSAFPQLKMAQALAKDDPLVIVAAGNALYYAGDLAGARNAYQQCIRLHPAYEPAYFNLGQYCFATMETAKGMDYTTQAARLNAVSVDSFIKKNDEYFSKDWPPLRQLMWPDFTPAYFWKNIFPAYCGTLNTAQERFGALFFGMPILWYAVLSLLLAALLFGFNSSVWSKDFAKRVSACKLCQTPVCRKCKRGTICRDCFGATQHIRNEQIRQRIMGKIQQKSLRTRAVTAIVLDLLFPGTGLLYRGVPAYQSLPLVAATSMVYASAVAFVRASFDYPAWALHQLAAPLWSAFAAYVAIFAIRAAFKTARVIKRQGD